MVRGLTAKQESFSLLVWQGMTAADAYRDIYSVENKTTKTIWEASSRLMANGKVIARITELRSKAVDEGLVTIASITAELEEARALAKSTEHSASMVSASMGKAKVNGLLVDKVEAKVDAVVAVESPSGKLAGFLDVIAKRGGETGEPS